jgi:drug/metabolite transporter (DMT)-like permease
MLASSIAAVFVVLWSTGFVVARAITPYADPNLFLLARFGATALMFLAPPLAALEGYVGFGETLLPVQIAAFALALIGVLLARS